MLYRNNIATLIGSLSILFWSLSALFTTELKNIPSYEIIFFIFGFSFLSIAMKLTLQRSWRTVLVSPVLIIFGSLFLFGVQYFYNQAFKYAPAMHADLINYLWPVYMMFISAFLPNEKLTLNQLMGALIAFLGIYIMLNYTRECEAMTQHPWIGYFYACLDGLCWAGYTLLTRHYKQAPTDMVGIYSLFAAIAALINHQYYEFHITPTSTQMGYMLFLGVFVVASGNSLWTFGVKHGNYKLMSVLSYLTPVLSVYWLAYFGKVTPNFSAVIAIVLITLGAYLTAKSEQLDFHLSIPRKIKRALDLS